MGKLSVPSWQLSPDVPSERDTSMVGCMLIALGSGVAGVGLSSGIAWVAIHGGLFDAKHCFHFLKPRPETPNPDFGRRGASRRHGWLSLEKSA